MKMSFTKSVIILSIVALAATAVSGICLAEEQEVTSGTIRLNDQKESAFPDLASITLFQAIKLALAEVKGKLLKVELEDENGYLVYTIEIVAADKSISEVMVDAGNGKVLLVEKDPFKSKHLQEDKVSSNSG